MADAICVLDVFLYCTTGFDAVLTAKAAIGMIASEAAILPESGTPRR